MNHINRYKSDFQKIVSDKTELPPRPIFRTLEFTIAKEIII